MYILNTPFIMSANRDISEHYNKIKNISLDERQNSKIINIRNINNFVKSVLIQKYTKKDDSVLDIGCGKGGDLKKYMKNNVSEYYGIDIAENSIEEAQLRLEQLNSDMRAVFDVCDAYTTYFDLYQQFDVISSQFSFHYAFQSRKAFETTVKNINTHLRVGGYFIATIPNVFTLLRRYKNYGNNFGNEYYKVSFMDDYDDILKREDKFGIAYKFSLAEAVEDCVEYLVPYGMLTDEFEECGIELVEHQTFMDFYNKNWLQNKDLHNKMIKSRLNTEELKVLELYSVIVYKKTK